MRRAARVLIASLVVAAACRTLPSRATSSMPSTLAAREWPATRALADQAALHRDFGRADSVLRAFAARYPGTESASETLFLRAVMLLDPAAEGPDSREYVRSARGLFDTYLAGGESLPHYAQAQSLRRFAAHVDSLQSAAFAAVQTVLGAQSARDSARAREDETTKLRTELEQTKAELERLRKRLAPPKP